MDTSRYDTSVRADGRGRNVRRKSDGKYLGYIVLDRDALGAIFGRPWRWGAFRPPDDSLVGNFASEEDAVKALENASEQPHQNHDDEPSDA